MGDKVIAEMFTSLILAVDDEGIADAFSADKSKTKGEVADPFPAASFSKGNGRAALIHGASPGLNLLPPPFLPGGDKVSGAVLSDTAPPLSHTFAGDYQALC